MSSIVVAIEAAVSSIPLPLLETWGRIAYLLGLLLAVVAFGGFTFRPAGRWGFGRERQAWDARAVLSIPVTFVLTTVTGYLGSFVVLVPGAQTLESLKDLVVFLCVVLFGYPALLTVPFAYGLSDLIEGVPPDLLLAWLPGYFVNPACFWLAYQIIGRNPDFRRASVWGRYLVFVVAFTLLEPVAWGYICSGTFGAEISYRAVTSALLFTTGITWLLAPFAMLGAFPLARRLGLFWAEIPDHVEERAWRYARPWDPSYGTPAGVTADPAPRGWPIRMILVTPFVMLVMLMVGATAYVTLRAARADVVQLATRLQEQTTDDIRQRLRSLPVGTEANSTAIADMLQGTFAPGISMIVDGNGGTIASSAAGGDAAAIAAAERVAELVEAGSPLAEGVTFRLDLVTERPLSRALWLGRATSFVDPDGPLDGWIVVTAMPESYYMAGVEAGSRRSALVFALALLLSLAMGAGLASRVTIRLREISDATKALAAGNLSVTIPNSRVVELGALARSFNDMARRLNGSVNDIGERETFLRLTQEAAGVGSWEWDLQGPLDRLRWSEQMARIHGIAASEFDGSPEMVLELCHPDDRDELVKVMQRIRAGDDFGAFTYRIQRRDGSMRELWVLGQVERNDHGVAIKVLGIALDVTDRKRMEDLLAAETRVMALIAGESALADTLATITTTFEALRPETLASILLLDDDGVHVRHGAAPSLPASYWEAIDGAPIGPKAGSCGTAAYRGKAVIVVDIDVDPLWDDYRALAQAHGLRACWSTPIVDPRGKVLGTFAMYYREPRSPTADDLRLIARATRLAALAIQRQKAREALQANEARLLEEKRFIDSLMNSLPGVVILFDLQGGLVKWNKVLERVTGYSAYDLSMMSALDLVSQTDVEALDEAVRAAHQGMQPSAEAHLVTRDGRAIPYYFTGVRLVTENGPHTLGIGVDISDRRRLEEQFQQAQKMEAMGHLAAGVAHDFNNLLTVISGHAQMMELEGDLADVHRESVDSIRGAVTRAASLTRQLLSFSRKTVLQPKVMDLNAEVGETEKMLDRVIGEGVTLTTDLAAGLRSIKVDPGQLSQVLMNLSVNARDAMPAGGTLTIRTRHADIDEEYCRQHPDAAPGSYVVLSVADTGTGMPPEVRRRIFEPFFTTKGVGKGTGLGLAMVYGVVRQSGGHIELTSEVGEGTTFHIYFPAVDDAPTSTAPSRADRGWRGTETVLLVEDEPAVRALSLRALRSHGYTVLVATDGADAIRIAEGFPATIDLVVTDVVMSGPSGRETVEILRQSRRELRVLYVSGYTDDAIVRHGVINHEVEFLPKPFTPLELVQKVREVLDVPVAAR